MYIYRNNANVYNTYVYDWDGYSSAYRSWDAGKYSVIISVGFGSIDVRDFTFRTYFPNKVTIGYKQYATVSAAKADLSTTANLSPSSTAITYPIYDPSQVV
jgi:hypothetical protein